jgi:hypothetical protein
MWFDESVIEEIYYIQFPYNNEIESDDDDERFYHGRSYC